MAFQPALLLWPLQMKLKLKFGLTCLMSLGVFAMICSVIRATHIEDLAKVDVSCKYAGWDYNSTHAQFGALTRSAKF